MDVDWRERFRVPTVRLARIAADRRDRGVVVSDRDGPIEAYAWDVPAGELRQVTSQGTATLVAGISHDGQQVLFLRDTTGAEQGHLHAVPFEGGEPVDLTPELPPYASLGAETLAPTTDGFVAGFTVDGTPHVVRRAGGSVRVVPVDGLPQDLRVTGATVAMTVPAPGRGMTGEVVLLDRETLTEQGRVADAVVTGAFDGTLGLGVVRDGWRRPALYGVDGSLRFLDDEVAGLAELLPGEVVPVAVAGGAVLLVASHRSIDRLAVVEDGAVRLLGLPLGTLESGVVDFDGTAATVVFSGATLPGTLLRVDADGHRQVLEDVEEVPGAPWRELTVTGSDGVEVQCWLLRPDGPGPHPTVVNGHGGPTAVQGPSFNPVAQAWVDHGYAYATVNYRGSLGFGERFREALTGNIGGPELHDVVAVRDRLVADGVADPERVVLNGYSYGGYLTCMLLGTHPDRWAAGIAGAPIVDWLQLHEASPATRGYAEALFGGGPRDVGGAMVAASPTAYVGDVQAPLLVSAPTDDARTPVGPVRRYVAMLRARGATVELDELHGGHAGVGTEQTIAMVERWLAFAEDVLADRDG